MADQPMTSSRLSRHRLAPGGAGGDAALAWATRLALIAVILAGAFLAYVVLRPLEQPIAIPEAGVPKAPEVQLVEDAQFDQRQQLVNALTSDNAFAYGRRDWPTTVADTTNDEDTTGVKATASDSTAPPPTIASDRAPDESEVVAFVNLPPDAKAALQGLRLDGVYVTDGDRQRGFKPGARGAYAARLTFVHAKSIGNTVQSGIVVTSGDRFYDTHIQDNTQHDIPWDVVYIDGEEDAVYLRRSDMTMKLALYPDVVVSTLARGTPRAEDDRVDFRPEDIYVAGASSEEISALLDMLVTDGTITAQDRRDLNDLMRDPGALSNMSLSKIIGFGDKTVETKSPEDDKNDGGIPEFPPALSAMLRAISSGEDPREVERRLRGEENEEEGEGDEDEDGEK